MPSSHAAPRLISKKREKITALPLYHSGHLLKKFTDKKDFQSFYGELRGSTIFLYSDDKQDMYSEKLELRDLKSMVMDKQGVKGGSPVYTLTLLSEKVQLKTDSLDTGEEWKGLIMTVANLEIPSNLQLLPGQVLKLEEILKMEHERNGAKPHSVPWDTSGPHTQAPKPLPMSPSNTYDDTISIIPPGFFSVSRQQAERMLEDYPNYGSIILRPAADLINYAITLRQVLPSGPVTRHFKVRSEASMFVIELDSPVTVSSLSAVLEFFVQYTSGSLRPYVEPQHYETQIDLCPPELPPSRPGPPLPPKPKKEQEEESEYIEPDLPEKGFTLAFREELQEILKKRKE
ncbi:signal-transducing adaptor protein 1-like [Arapaima gigas]